jgi:glyceraldehyde 3-phosphate dehydrogenase
MPIKVGINGFGRIGRLAFRAAFDNPDIQFEKINDPAGDAQTLAHLLNFDSIQGRWNHTADHQGNAIQTNRYTTECTSNTTIDATDWSHCDVVIEASGKMRKPELLQQYLAQGVKKVVVTAPVAAPEILNIVMGVNHQRYNHTQHHVVTAASCTTNCLAPIVSVIHQGPGIVHGSITTIHDITNTQSILDQPHSDLRRARACGSNLIPTTTGSAKAISLIFPELEGKLNGHAVRVPLANASITDCVFETKRPVTEDEINQLFQQASVGPLRGILGYENRPLVSSDYRGDPRSCVIDGPSTMVINCTQLKIYAWYDNEWGYANRTVELVNYIAADF